MSTQHKDDARQPKRNQLHSDDDHLQRRSRGASHGAKRSRIDDVSAKEGFDESTQPVMDSANKGLDFADEVSFSNISS